MATNAVRYQKDKLQKYVEKCINSDSSCQLITKLAKATCNKWASIINNKKILQTSNISNDNKDNYQEEDNRNIDRDKNENYLYKKFSVVRKNIEKENLRAAKLEFANNSKNLAKFKQKESNNNNILVTGLLSGKQTLGLYKRVSNNCLCDHFHLH